MKKNELKLHLDVHVHTTDHKNKQLKRSGAEILIEKVLCDVFRLYVQKFTDGKHRLIINRDSVKAEAL